MRDRMAADHRHDLFPVDPDPRRAPGREAIGLDRPARRGLGVTLEDYDEGS